MAYRLLAAFLISFLWRREHATLLSHCKKKKKKKKKRDGACKTEQLSQLLLLSAAVIHHCLRTLNLQEHEIKGVCSNKSPNFKCLFSCLLPADGICFNQAGGNDPKRQKRAENKRRRQSTTSPQETETSQEHSLTLLCIRTHWTVSLCSVQITQPTTAGLLIY